MYFLKNIGGFIIWPYSSKCYLDRGQVQGSIFGTAILTILTLMGYAEGVIAFLVLLSPSPLLLLYAVAIYIFTGLIARSLTNDFYYVE
jgi:hypothetical protein